MAFDNGWRGPDIVTDGLVLYLDAGSPNSYRTDYGTTWRDISGNGRNFTITNATFSSNNEGRFYFNGTNTNYADGPASNTFGVTYDHTVEIVLNPETANTNATFKWSATGPSDSRGIFAHTPWVDNTFYYDVGGCCAGDTRLTYNNSTLYGKISHMAYRARDATTPRRSIFLNGVSVADSGENSNSSFTLNTTAARIGGNPSQSSENFRGHIYLLRLYNRALTDAEILQNYNAQKSRFGL